MLKWWVWPMIKCSHLTPKSIYSYIDDIVIANCLIDARIVCACFVTCFICYLIVWACWLHNFSIRGHPFIILIVWILFAKWMDKNAKEPPLAIYAFSLLKLYSCYITKIEQVFFVPFGWGALGATDPSRAAFQNLLVNFGQTNTLIFGPTKTTRLI